MGKKPHIMSPDDPHFQRIVQAINPEELKRVSEGLFDVGTSNVQLSGDELKRDKKRITAAADSDQQVADHLLGKTVNYEPIQFPKCLLEHAIHFTTKKYIQLSFHFSRISLNERERMCYLFAGWLPHVLPEGCEVDADDNPLWRDRWDLMIYNTPCAQAKALRKAILRKVARSYKDQ